MSEITYIKIEVDSTNPIPHQQKIIPQCRPNWNVQEVKFQTSPKGVATGCINTMVTAFVNDEKHDAVMFRIYGGEAFDEFFNRKLEVYNIKMVNKLHGFAPNVILSFDNGFCYDFINGVVMTSNDLLIEDNWRLVAKQIALLHSTNVDEKFRANSKIMDFVPHAPDKYPESLKNPAQNKILQESLPTKEYVQDEMKHIVKVIDSLDYKLCLCHNDLRPENMVWNKERGTITFVDFELASFARQAGDIAYNFWRYTGVENNDYSKYPGKDFQISWLKVYLETYNKATKGIGTFTEEEIQRLYVQVNVHYLLYLVQTICAVSFVDNPGFADFPFDFFSCTVPSYNEYRKVKDSILALTLPD